MARTALTAVATTKAVRAARGASESRFFAIAAAPSRPSHSHTLSAVVPRGSSALASPLARRPLPPPSLPTSAVRLFRSSAPSASSQYTISKLDQQEYHTISDHALECLTEYLEALLEESDTTAGAGQEYDVEYSSGVLTLRMGSAGTYVINKQPPNQQIWLSSPRSGPKRFDYDAEHKVWFSLKEGQTNTLHDLLDTELADLLGHPVKVNLGEDEI